MPNTVVDAPYAQTWSELNRCGIEETAFYTGQVFKGRRHGEGTARYPETGDRYEGEWKNDLFDGWGVYEYENGDVYEGNWKAGQRHGHGHHRYVEGAFTYLGTWSRDKFAVGRMKKRATGTCNSSVVAEGDWATWTWTKGAWDTVYPREGQRGVMVTARRSGPPPRYDLRQGRGWNKTGGTAPRKQLAQGKKPRW